MEIRTSIVMVALVLVQFSSAARAEDNPLVHEGTVTAPVDEVWAAFTTKEGQESWMVAHSEIELKVGGRMRTHYDPKGTIGDPKTIENTIICYDPKHLLSLKVSKPPEGFPFANAVKNMWTVIYFEAAGLTSTRVRVVGLGFGEDEESKKMRAFFDRGNAYTLKKLQQRFASNQGGNVTATSKKLAYLNEIQEWREAREKRLRADNGWLTLAGRYPLKEGANTFGTGKDNDVIFPAALKGTGPERLGTLQVDPEAKKVTLKLPDGVSMTSGGKSFSGERTMGTDKRDWVSLGRLSMHIIERDGKYFLRLADNESPVRKKFAGCVWYPPNEAYKVEARFVPYGEGRTLSIVNIIDEHSKEPCPGYAEFQLNGEVHRLDAIKEGGGLFFVFRDATAGDTTYQSARFIDIAKQPKANETFILDFNKAYNPPCAFAAYTTCPLPPKQNILPVRIEGGEKYRQKL